MFAESHRRWLQAQSHSIGCRPKSVNEKEWLSDGALLSHLEQSLSNFASGSGTDSFPISCSILKLAISILQYFGRGSAPSTCYVCYSMCRQRHTHTHWTCGFCGLREGFSRVKSQGIAPYRRQLFKQTCSSFTCCLKETAVQLQVNNAPLCKSISKPLSALLLPFLT